MKKLLLINVLLVSQVQAQIFASSPLTNQFNATQDQMTHAKSVANYAAMSFNAYWGPQKDPTDGWKLAPRVVDFEPLSKGFNYQVYKKYQNGKLVEVSIAYRGTDMINPFKRDSDSKEWAGGPQYVDAVAVAKNTYSKYSQFNIPITTTGHSLGGGLAQAAAFFIPNAKAVVFNTSPLDLAGVRQGILDLFADGRSEEVKRIFGTNELPLGTGALLVTPYLPSPTQFTSETHEILTGIASGGRGTRYNFTKALPFTAHGVEVGFSAMVDGLAILANPSNPSPFIYFPNINSNLNLKPAENVNSFGEPSIVNSRFNGAYSVPFGTNVSVVRYDNLRFDADGTTAKFTAFNALGQTSNAARNGASILGRKPAYAVH